MVSVISSARGACVACGELCVTMMICVVWLWCLRLVTTQHQGIMRHSAYLYRSTDQIHPAISSILSFASFIRPASLIIFHLCIDAMSCHLMTILYPSSLCLLLLSFALDSWGWNFGGTLIERLDAAARCMMHPRNVIGVIYMELHTLLTTNIYYYI